MDVFEIFQKNLHEIKIVYLKKIKKLKTLNLIQNI